MKEIISIKQAENFINNYDLYKSKAENQTELFVTLEKCESLAIAQNDNKLLCRCRIFLTNYYIQINDLDNALKLGIENKKNTEEFNLQEENLRTYSGLIEIYNTIGDYAKLEEIIHEYQDKLIHNNDYSKLCTLYIILGIQAKNLKNYEDIIAHGKKAIEFGKLSNNPNLLVYAYSNLGFQYLDKDILIAKEALENALDVIKQHKKEIAIYSVAIVGINLSKMYIILEDYKQSYKHIKSSIAQLEKQNIKYELTAAKIILSELFIRTNKLSRALTLLNEIEAESIEHNNNPNLLSCYECYVDLFEKKKKYKLALEYYKKKEAINEKIYNEETNKKIYTLQASYEVKTIKRQRDYAETVANLKHDFLANMSHEIRTPINSVLGIAYLLQQSQLNEKQQKFVHRLQRSGENLLALINDILDISKIEAGKIELIPIEYNLFHLIENIHQQLLYKAEEKNINFTTNVPKELNTEVLVDANRLTQIITNIVANSIKFTEKGEVVITLKIVSKMNKKVVVEFAISDTGIGIAVDKINSIFERYEQVTTSNFGGTGLGLAISKKLVELMNGKIEVSSKEQKGTTFKVTIPFIIAENLEINQNKTIDIPTNFLAHKHILIADDIEENRLIIKEILENFNENIIIDEVSDGNEVLQKIKEKPYDLILMDLDMSGKNGIDTTIEIKKSKKYEHIKIMAHTASLITITEQEMLEIGFDELLLKPFIPNDFLKKIAKLLL